MVLHVAAKMRKQHFPKGKSNEEMADVFENMAADCVNEECHKSRFLHQVSGEVLGIPHMPEEASSVPSAQKFYLVMTFVCSHLMSSFSLHCLPPN